MLNSYFQLKLHSHRLFSPQGSIFDKICSNLTREPQLQPLTGEKCSLATANTATLSQQKATHTPVFDCNMLLIVYTKLLILILCVYKYLLNLFTVIQNPHEQFVTYMYKISRHKSKITSFMQHTVYVRNQHGLLISKAR